MKSSNDGLWDWDLVTDTVYFSPRYLEMLGYGPFELPHAHATFVSLLHPADRARVSANWRGFVVGTAAFSDEEFRMLHKSGKVLWILPSVEALRAADGRAVRMVGTHRDVTARIEGRIEREQLLARLRLLSVRLVAAQEEERARVARELHDEVGQSLTALKLNLHGAARARGADATSEELQESLAIADRVMSQVRNLSLDLRPPQLDSLGLAAALRWHADRLGRGAGWRSHVDVAILPQRLRADCEIAAFRIAQEVLTNVARHAGASNIWIDLLVVDGRIRLTIRDDGRGFDVAAAFERAARGDSAGLSNLRERALLADGTCEIVSSPAGTCITAGFPAFFVDREVA